MTPDAFSALYARAHGPLLAYLSRRLPLDDIEDVAQGVWLRAWRAWERYEDRGLPLDAWLYRIAHNALANHYRDQSHRITCQLDGHDRSGGDVEHEALSRIAFRDVMERARALPFVERRALVVAMTQPRYRTVAEKTALHRACKRLREGQEETA